MGPILRHVNLFTWKEATTEADIEALTAVLQKLPEEIPEVKAIFFGADLGLMEGNVDFAILLDFEDAEAFRRYTAHPAHDRMVKDFIRPMMASRQAVQFRAPAAAS